MRLWRYKLDQDLAPLWQQLIENISFYAALPILSVSFRHKLFNLVNIDI